MRTVLFSLVFLFSLTVKASVVSFPENLIVESINGIEQSGHFFAQETRIELAAGNHVLVLKYQDLFDGDDDHTKVRSKPFVVLFTLTSVQAKENITASTPSLDELSDAKRFAKNPKIKLVNASGKQISAINQSLLSFNAANKFQQLSNVNQAKDAHSANSASKHTIIANTDGSTRLKTAVATPTLSNIACKENDSRLEQLKCLWNLSSQSEQEAFVYFVLAQQQAALNTK